MYVIYKYEIRERFQKLDIPAGGEILYADIGYTEQFRETIFIWVKVNKLANKKVRYFEVYNTGEPMSPNEPKVYIRTVKFPSGIIQHIFEVFKYIKYETDK